MDSLKKEASYDLGLQPNGASDWVGQGREGVTEEVWDGAGSGKWLESKFPCHHHHMDRMGGTLNQS